MKMRLAWIADAEDVDSYSGRETRVLLRALAQRAEMVLLWFAVGSREGPHFWNGVRVFPLPTESLGSAEFLKTLIVQQRPHLIFVNLSEGRFKAGLDYLAQNGIPWIHRFSPEETQRGSGSEAVPSSAQLALGNPPSNGSISLPFLRELNVGANSGEEPTAVLEQLRRMITQRAPAQPAEAVRPPTNLVMRQQLFCNASLAHVMFELTNALIELDVPAVAQDEHSILSKGFIHREEELLSKGAAEKYQRVASSQTLDYDPEAAITVHFSMLKPGTRYARLGVFRSLSKREVLYTTGNHTVAPDGLRQLTDDFEMVLAPSWHVLRPYLEAGLNRDRGAVVPHGVDPTIFTPEAPRLIYATSKRFKFLQTSFPWICEKGFDLSIKAFCRCFSNLDDVALILRTPAIRDRNERDSTFGRLEALVKEESAKSGAPEILLLEQDVGLSDRGGVYTGADCYLFPLRAEGFGMTILEAMASGLPVIATPWSGPADYLSPRYAYTLRHSSPIAERSRNGTLLRYHVEPDLEHLIHLMRHVYEHQDEARSLGRLASVVARQQWTWRHAAVKLASLFSLLPVGTGLQPAAGGVHVA